VSGSVAGLTSIEHEGKGELWGGWEMRWCQRERSAEAGVGKGGWVNAEARVKRRRGGNETLTVIMTFGEYVV